MEMWRGYTKEALRRLETSELEKLLAEHGFSNGESLDIGFIRCVTEILSERNPAPVLPDHISWDSFSHQSLCSPAIFPEVCEELGVEK